MAGMQVQASRDLMREGSDLVEVSLIASRARSAALRAESGEALDEVDLSALEVLGAYLDDVASSVQFFASGGALGAAPHGAFTARVDATLDAAHERPGAETADAMAETLREFAAISRQIESRRDEASDLSAFLSELASSALRQAGHVGETTSTF